MEAGAVNEAQDRLVDIYNKAKAKAGRADARRPHEGEPPSADASAAPPPSATLRAPSSPSPCRRGSGTCCFFVVPVGWSSSATASATSRRSTRAELDRLDHLSLENYRDALVRHVLHDVFRQHAADLVIGTALCLLIGFPFAYCLAVKVPAEVAGAAARRW